jgi:hypothetical protein
LLKIKTSGWSYKTQLNIMRHVQKALVKLVASEIKNPAISDEFIAIENVEYVKGVAPIVKFTIQSDPIGEVGVNGCQALDMLKYVKCLFESLNDSFPCFENDKTISHIQEAIEWQNARTKDRLARKVEGANKA